MFARVTTIEGSPERIDESIRLFKETVVPGVSKIKGFKGSYFLVDRKTGKQMGVAPDEGYEKEGMMYCCEPCAPWEGQCEYGCCAVAEEQEQ